MNQQFDLLGFTLDKLTVGRLGLPQPREVRKPKLPNVLSGKRQDFDAGHELVLAERARSDHR